MKIKTVNTILTALTVLLVVTQVIVFMLFGIQNGPTSQAQAQQKRLQEENRQLQSKIDQLTAYSQLENRAKEAGFIAPDANYNEKGNIVYLTQQVPLALKD